VAPDRRPARRLALLGLAYGPPASLVVAILALIPALLGIGLTLLTGRESVVVSLALFWVGGWGLGRDIELEAGLAREQARADALAREAERAQLLALRGQLDPHFLFNTLNAIAEWCRTDGEVAERASSSSPRCCARSSPASRSPPGRSSASSPSAATSSPSTSSATPTCSPSPSTATPATSTSLRSSSSRSPRTRSSTAPPPATAATIRLTSPATADGATVTLDNPGPYRGPRDGSEGLPTVHKRLALAYPARRHPHPRRHREHGTRATLRLPPPAPPSHLT
jgi:two-component system sensor histidine kinase AlgZ